MILKLTAYEINSGQGDVVVLLWTTLGVTAQ